jgi:predicted nuclease of predicted toxin-antitoxin system
VARFLVDEDLPMAVVRALRAGGHDALHVCESNIRGHPDEAVHALALDQARTVVTADLGLANPFRYPNPVGTVLVRLPNTTLASEIARRVAEGLDGLSLDQLAGATIVIEFGRVRVRRSAP